MKARLISRGLGIASAAVILASCSTTETRIADNPGMFQSLSRTDQELVSRGQVRVGMSQDAVWLAWGSADQKAVGAMRGRSTETWVYFTTTYASGYGYGYGGYGYGGYGYPGFGYGGVIRHHGRHRFVFVGAPYYDPFYYSYIPPSVSYPYKTVTFSNGRVLSFQQLVGPYRY